MTGLLDLFSPAIEAKPKPEEPAPKSDPILSSPQPPPQPAFTFAPRPFCFAAPTEATRRSQQQP
ncbi:MAG: hypothetical protein KGJ13_12485, partial [Patescibacteria group bacterium]|nr:hypothetical protein [Patescibacteria group bacterium]